MRKISKKAKLGLVVGALLAMVLAYGVVTYAYDPDPPVGFVAPTEVTFTV